MRNSLLFALAITAATLCGCGDSTSTGTDDAESAIGSSESAAISGEGVSTPVESSSSESVPPADIVSSATAPSSSSLQERSSSSVARSSSSSSSDTRDCIDDGKYCEIPYSYACSDTSIKVDSSYVPSEKLIQVSSYFFWDGRYDTEGKVETGSTEETSGFLYDFSNDACEGHKESRIYFPADVKTNEYGNFFGPLVEDYGGIKGVAKMGNSKKPGAGVTFDIVSEEQEGADIRDWRGICITYNSTADFKIVLVEEHADFVTEFNNYTVTVPKSNSFIPVDFSWDKFAQEEGWGKIVDQEEILKRTAAISLLFESDAEFHISRIGSLRECRRVCCM